ncbi:MAG: transcriptional regulator FtrA [Bradyrhizobium sp.]|nr:transcriptional regulator FtrA [Bradyrhizobium sp.]
MLAEHKVAIVASDGLGVFEFGIALEVFGLPRPEMGPGWYRTIVVAGQPGPLRALGQIVIQTSDSLEALLDAETIVVPSWRSPAEPVPKPLVATLREAHARGARLVSICSGAFVLAATGALAGRRAVTHWRHAQALANAYPDITVQPDVLYVDEGDVLTSAGGAAGIDLCLHIVRKDFGAAAANQVARRLIVPPHREGGQAQYIERPISHSYEGGRLGPLLDQVRQRLDEEISVSALAREVGMSDRTFLRKFVAATGMAPTDWLMSERLYRARELLEGTDLSIERVAETSGFGSAATLRHHFRNRLDSSPASYRRQFSRL